jgi:hypothetical protein
VSVVSIDKFLDWALLYLIFVLLAAITLVVCAGIGFAISAVI